VPWLREGCLVRLAGSSVGVGMCHGTYQHEAITSRSRQRLLMGTWLPETC